jgi:hypothetical protein
MGTPSNNRQSLFLPTSDDEEPRSRNSLEPWNDFNRRSPGDVSLTLPMISGSNDTTEPQQPHSHRQRAPWQDPFSDQLTPRRPQPQQFPLPSALGSEGNEDFYGSTPDFAAFDWDDITNLPTSRQTPNRTRESSIVDLTETSPVTMPRASNKRRQPSADSDGRTPKRRKESGRKLEKAKDDNKEGKSDAKVEELDLIDVDDDTTYAEIMKKRQEDLIRQQRQAELDKPLKLATTQCVICLDQPEDLVVTHCGTSLSRISIHYNTDYSRTHVLLVMPPWRT